MQFEYLRSYAVFQSDFEPYGSIYILLDKNWFLSRNFLTGTKHDVSINRTLFLEEIRQWAPKMSGFRWTVLIHHDKCYNQEACNVHLYIK